MGLSEKGAEDLEMKCEDFLFDIIMEEIDTETITSLQDDMAYQELVSRQEEIWEKYPILKDFFDETEEITLTKEEHKAVLKYQEIQQKRELAERKGYYWCGQKHAFSYLRKVNGM